MDGGCSAYIVALCDLGTEDKNIFVECHTSDILHRTPVVFSNCNLVVLTKWIGKTEGLLKVGKALLGDFKDIFGINILKE